MNQQPDLHYRPMGIDDANRVPIDCQGERNEIVERIKDLGASAILVFDGKQHVGQLQFRRHSAALRSSQGIWHPDYWGDFGDTQPTLPDNTLGIFCYHVGQLEPGEGRDSSYFGRGIGQSLLSTCMEWARDNDFEAIVAKHTPSNRGVMAFMGGQPAEVYEANGFEVASSWIDRQLLETVHERGLADSTASDVEVGQVGMCIKHLS